MIELEDISSANYRNASLASIDTLAIKYVVVFSGVGMEPPLPQPPRNFPTFIWQVKSDQASIELKTPLRVTIQPLPFGFMVSSEDYDLHGHGESKESAVNDFMDSFVSDFLNLKNTPTKELADDAKALLARYRAAISRLEINPAKDD